jgi:hypothetical protein
LNGDTLNSTCLNDPVNPSGGAERAHRPTWGDTLGLTSILHRFDEANNRYLRAQTIKDAREAEMERLEAAGMHMAAGEDLGQLLMVLLLFARKHFRQELALSLADVLHELRPMLIDIIREVMAADLAEVMS